MRRPVGRPVVRPSRRRVGVAAGLVRWSWPHRAARWQGGGGAMPTKHDPGLLAHLVGIELGLRERSPVPPLDLLTGYLAPCSVLLVLDNCEHLVPACSVLADALLRSCPRLRILATGREPLGIGGETLF